MKIILISFDSVSLALCVYTLYISKDPVVMELRRHGDLQVFVDGWSFLTVSAIAHRTPVAWELVSDAISTLRGDKEGAIGVRKLLI